MCDKSYAAAQWEILRKNEVKILLQQKSVSENKISPCVAVPHLFISCKSEYILMAVFIIIVFYCI